MSMNMEHDMHEFGDRQMQERHWPQEHHVDSDQIMDTPESPARTMYSPSMGVSVNQEQESQGSDMQTEDKDPMMENDTHGMEQHDTGQHGMERHGMEQHVEQETGQQGSQPSHSMQRPGNDPALEYGPVRTTKLTEAMRKNLDNLDFGRPRHDTPETK